MKIYCLLTKIYLNAFLYRIKQIIIEISLTRFKIMDLNVLQISDPFKNTFFFNFRILSISFKESDPYFYCQMRIVILIEFQKCENSAFLAANTKDRPTNRTISLNMPLLMKLQGFLTNDCIQGFISSLDLIFSISNFIGHISDQWHSWKLFFLSFAGNTWVASRFMK